MNFPKEAEAVRKYIRDNVGRPETLPILQPFCGNLALRWDGKCPLGLCPAANHDFPIGFHHFYPAPPFTEEQMNAFVNFWDQSTDPQYAVDTVWGEV